MQPKTPIIISGLSFFDDKAGDLNFGSSQTALTVSSILSLSPEMTMTVGIQPVFVQYSVDYTNAMTSSQYNGSFYENLAAVLPNGPCDPTGAEGEITADLQDGCVAVNMFAPSLYNGIIGEFADQAERDYLFDTSVFDTEIIQTIDLNISIIFPRFF